jgi:hypothetical protein
MTEDPQLAADLAGPVTDELASVLAQAVKGRVRSTVQDALESAVGESEVLDDFSRQVEDAVAELLDQDAIEASARAAVMDLRDELAAGEQAPQPYFPTLDVFVTKQLLQVYRRDASLNEVRWCRVWWEHIDVVYIFTGLWRAWEHLRLDPTTGMAVWYRDYAMPLMGYVINPQGPFMGCNEDHHAKPPLKPLPTEPVPEGLFDPSPAEAAHPTTPQS